MNDYQLPMHTRLKLVVPGSEREYAVELRERFDDTLLMRVPAELANATPGDEVVLKFGHEKFFWNVNVHLTGYHSIWWFIEQPEPSRWMRLQRRQFVRIEYEEPVIAIPDLTDISLGLAPLHLRMTDVSASGCAIVSDEPVEHKRITFVLRLPEGQVLSVPAIFAWGEAREDGTHAYGFDFIHQAPATRDDLAHWVALRIQKGLSTGVDITT